METAATTIARNDKNKGGIMESAHEQPKFHLVRIVEALIIGALCAGVTMWGTQSERISIVRTTTAAGVNNAANPPS